MTQYQASDEYRLHLDDVPQLPRIDDYEQRLDPYRVRGDRDRLRGAQMIAAIIRDWALQPVSRESLHDALIDYFGGRQTLQHYWSDIDGAFDAALVSAVGFDFVMETPNAETGGALYTPGWLLTDGATAQRLRAEGRWPG